MSSEESRHINAQIPIAAVAVAVDSFLLARLASAGGTILLRSRSNRSRVKSHAQVLIAISNTTPTKRCVNHN